MNFDSFVPINYKKIVVTSLTDVVFKLSDPQDKFQNLTFQNNSQIFKKIIHGILNATDSLSERNSPESKYISLPYTPEINCKIQKSLYPYKIRVANKPWNTNKKTL